MRKLVVFFGVQFLKISGVFAQCSGGSNGGALSPVPSAGYQTMSVTSGNYYTFTVPAGCMPTYDFSFCSADLGSASFDTQLTILDNSGTYANGYNDDYCSLQSHVTWTPSSAGVYRVLANSYPCGASGATATLAYKITTQANMSVTSATTVQSNTTTVTKCDIDQDVICLQVVTAGNCNALALTQFQLGAGSSSSGTLADISKIHIYYTGTSNTFSATNEFVTGGTSPAGGTNNISGSQTLTQGTNYFWIAYDINPAATTSNLVDASCTQFTVSGVNQVPTATNPTGTRTINVCTSYPGSSSTNIKLWLKADAGTTTSGSSVTQWNDQSGAGVTGNFTVQSGTPTQSSPTLVNSSVNFNPTVSFDGVTNSLASNNAFTGNTMYNANNNSIFALVNQQSGIVWHKWETAGTGSYRVGFETNGNSIRFDFVDDVTGKNSNSATNVANNYVICRGTSDATLNTIALNAKIDGTTNISGLSFSPGASTSRIAIGNNTINTNNLPTKIDLSELIEYNTKLSSSETRRVESYLAIKYGITLYNNQGSNVSVTYMASDGSSAWSNQTGYHNYVIGLGKDNTSTLNQLKSTSTQSLNGSVDIVTLANGSLTSPTAITNDKTFLMSGNNAGTLATPTLEFLTHNGPATTIAYQLTRVWVTQKTGTLTGNVIMQFDMTQINGPTGYGTNINADMRLLVDDDANFYNASAGEHTYSPNAGYSATGGTINFTVLYSDIQSGTGYYTLGSVNTADGTLPVSITSFNASCEKEKANVTWTTATETNNDFFTVERSSDSRKFTELSRISGSGTSTLSHSYSYFDNTPFNENYYRLKQTDLNGRSTYFKTIFASCNEDENSTIVIFPNPATSGITIVANTISESSTVFIYDMLGKLRYSVILPFTEQEHSFQIALDDAFTPGVYTLVLQTSQTKTVYKLVKQ